MQILENSSNFDLLAAQTEMNICAVQLGKSKVLIEAKTSLEIETL